MSSDVTSQPPNPTPPPTWVPLPLLERRVLGVLVEKQKTGKTADSYPLTLNSLTTGCNQKSNRDPVLDLTEDEVEEIIGSLQKKSLVTKVTGSRVDRFRHELYEVWTRNGPQLAVLAELLLRGPQTKGELRTRASRMAAIDTLEDLEEVLQPLVERRLVVYLGDPDRRGTQLTHGFHTPQELGLARSQAASAASLLGTVAEPSAAPQQPVHQPAPSPSLEEFAQLEARLTTAHSEIATLKASMALLEAQVADIRKQLGLTPT